MSANRVASESIGPEGQARTNPESDKKLFLFFFLIFLAKKNEFREKWNAIFYLFFLLILR